MADVYGDKVEKGGVGALGVSPSPISCSFVSKKRHFVYLESRQLFAKSATQFSPDGCYPYLVVLTQKFDFHPHPQI
jgi:hypothetical protein